jgi:hypothetical protein
MGPAAPAIGFWGADLRQHEATLHFAAGVRSVRASCPDGEILTGCSGWFDLVCTGAARCGYLGAYPDGEDPQRPRACVAQAHNGSGTAGTLVVYALCR